MALFTSMCSLEKSALGRCSEVCSKVAPACCGASADCRPCGTIGELDFSQSRACRYHSLQGCEGWDEALAMPGYDARAEASPCRRRGQPKTEVEEFAELSRQYGFKICPRCQNACEKQDENSCDHMTCFCGHEFCWSCLADRRVILAHGNHFHNPGCRFWREYKGPAELEKACPRCQATGRPCEPPVPLPTLSAANSWMASAGYKAASAGGLRNLASTWTGTCGTVSGPQARSVSRPTC